MKGDEKPPIVVVMLDGDEQGRDSAEKVAAIIDPKQVCTLREVECAGRVFDVLEDIIPVALIDVAIKAYVQRLGFACAATFDGTSAGSNNAKRIASFCKSNVPAFAAFDDAELRAGVVDSLVDLLADLDVETAGLAELRTHVEEVCKRLNEMIEYAERNSNRYSLKKLVRQQVETFVKRFPRAASKSDVKKLLLDVKHIAVGRGEDFERTHKNIQLMLERLDVEADENSDAVVIANWRTRFERFKNDPWAKVQDWGSIVATPLPVAGEPGDTPSGSKTPVTVQVNPEVTRRAAQKVEGDGAATPTPPKA